MWIPAVYPLWNRGVLLGRGSGAGGMSGLNHYHLVLPGVRRALAEPEIPETLSGLAPPALALVYGSPQVWGSKVSQEADQWSMRAPGCMARRSLCLHSAVWARVGAGAALYVLTLAITCI